MTADHLGPVLENPRDTHLLFTLGEKLARAEIPDSIVGAIRLGRLTALQKPSGGVREIVAGDILRRIVARTIAQQISSHVERTTAPFQYAMSTRAGTECIAHVLQALTELDPRATIMSIDGVGAFDLISRKTMLEALMEMESGSQVLPFVRMFYGSHSTSGRDEAGVVHTVEQGEGGEQGDVLMRALVLSRATRSLKSGARGIARRRAVVRIP